MSKMDHGTVSFVMMHALRCAAVASQMSAAGLEGADFVDTPYSHYAVPVDALMEYRRTQRDEPSYSVMEMLCARAVQRNPAMKHQIPMIRDFLNRAYNTPQTELRPDFVLATKGQLQDLIDEVKTGPAMRRLGLETDTHKRNELFSDLQTEHNRTRVTSAQYTDIFDPEVAERLTALSGRRDTGVQFLDKAVGGIERVALEGLIAGTGGGKTMFGTMRACESVVRNRNTMLLQYEQTLQGDVVERFYSYVGKVPRDQMAGGYAAYPERFKEKIAQMRPVFRKHLRVFGMAGDVEGQGTGGVPEIDAIIRKLDQTEGWRPELVIIDWLEPLWSAWDQNKPKNSRSKTEEYKYLISKLKELRDAWATNVLLLHQIAPHHMERLTPAMKPDKTMAEEVKSFPNLMNYCYTFGKKDVETDCMWFVVSKARTAANTSRIVKMDAVHNKILDMHGMYVLNDAHGVEGEHTFVEMKRGEAKVSEGA